MVEDMFRGPVQCLESSWTYGEAVYRRLEWDELTAGFVETLVRRSDERLGKHPNKFYAGA